MKKRLLFAVALLASATGAFAQGVKVRGVLGMGLTFGGDTLASARYDSSSSYGSDNVKIHAGGLIAFNGGVEVQFTDLVSSQVLISYHADRANASNGSIRFERYPLEVLGHFRANNWFRLGGGLRYTDSAKLRASGAGTGYASNEDFKPSYGSVVEGEFFPLQSWGIKLRYVSEKFRSKTNLQRADVDGSHGGVYFNYYF